MELIIKKFDELTPFELRDIYAARVSVFVVEQNCPYQEIDQLDDKAYHLWYQEDGRILAYLRVIEAGYAFKEVAIGRVITLRRGEGLGLKLLKEGIDFAQKQYGTEKIRIEAQTYAKAFYEKAGFIQDSQEFLEDSIPHIEMIWKKQ